MVVNGPLRSGDFFNVGSSVSRSQRALALSTTVFITSNYMAGWMSDCDASDAELT